MRHAAGCLVILVACGGDSDEAWIEEVGINEMVARGAQGDWVELHNVTSTAVDVGGWSLATEQGETQVLEAGQAVGAGGFLTVDLDLVDSGGTVRLFDGDDQLIDRATYPDAEADAGFGRVPDAAPNWQRIEAPTPGTSNG